MTKKIFSPSKVDSHSGRIDAYWKGKSIFPVTMELDLTQLCTRSCADCPFSVSRQAGHTLQLPFLDRLFSIIGPVTPGLIISGGEPTSVPHYPETLALARSKGFQEVSTISNGTCLDDVRVQDALLQYGTAVRVSLYDWWEGPTDTFSSTLKKIEHFRKRVDLEGSQLQIGSSILTSSKCLDKIEDTALKALEAGAHWVYFHPFCVDWESSTPKIADQSGVLSIFDKLGQKVGKKDTIQFPQARYEISQLQFSRLHGAHFLLQVGADGIVYAGPECKYDKDYALLDLKENLDDDFLDKSERRSKINAINSSNYKYIATRHRPPMFSDYLEQTKPDTSISRPEKSSEQFLHPSLI